MDKYLLTTYIKFPSTVEEKQAVKEKFYQEFRFPGVIGAIDGSHIKLKTPSKDIEHVYVCRKGGHSINVQVVCDMDLRILDCDAHFGGTAHDASVWRASALKVTVDILNYLI
ncbi:PREDICTED: putative nuclease HARBI1 isoform X1 [Rhagoletis zephyria]|uniref:putative nuclease HARBI1 isoform X1 n=1 Tax=Rhagoletis zephyria TaxID=28612 RepID=UPI0008119486|nr:PREDICTED: putative nuclease HARBI1 isoform X1 [Rhagoletis zephyria]